MDNIIEKATRSKRRSSIFKPPVVESQPAQPQVEVEANINYPKDYGNRLRYEIDQWKFTLESLKREFAELESQLAKAKNVHVNRDLLNYDLHIFDRSLYHNYIQSFQNLHKRLDCFLDKRELIRKKDVKHYILKKIDL